MTARRRTSWSLVLAFLLGCAIGAAAWAVVF